MSDVNVGPQAIDDRLLANLERLKQWCRAQDPNATIWLHIDEATRALKDAERQRRIAIEWANQSVDSVKEAMWEAQDALRLLRRANKRGTIDPCPTHPKRSLPT